MQALLEGWGCRVLTAQTSEQAKQAFASADVDAVIADYQIREPQTGLQLLEAFREQRADLRVALLTAEATEAVIHTAAARQVQVIRKPANPEEIRQFLLRASPDEKSQAAE